MYNPFHTGRSSAAARGLPAAAALAVQFLLLALGLLLAFALRFDFAWHTPAGVAWLTAWYLPILVPLLAIKMLVFLGMGLHRGTWRYVSLPDILGLFAGSQIALGLAFAALYAAQAGARRFAGTPFLAGLPESVLVLDFLLGAMLLGGVRLLVRLAHEESRPGGRAAGGLTRVLILGAGAAADALLREISRNPAHRYRVIGLLDDSPAKQRMRLHGVPVLGTIDQLPAICQRQQIGEILIALPSASQADMQRIVSLCRSVQIPSSGEASGARIRFRIVPSLSDLIAGRQTISAIRDVSVNDVLGRDAVQTDLGTVGAMLHDQVVLVSGAGGSIGSEICRTVAQYQPRRLVLLDKAENAVFEIERELRRSFPALELTPALGDISDPVRVEQVMGQFKPAIVFHAAAHKHVPLAESNPGEAIRNNVFGTKTLADAAAATGVAHFVMISTDKAVNPSSIMGATKRCAEIYVQALARRSRTNFLTVRFGNVLGSNGSVVPIFKQQIAAGGPVTVTHPEMRRYFMTIREASQLVLQAGALGRGGEIFVLDMGAPVRILDLARDLIMLSGLRPEVDIPIVFTGLRPGEKLYEELSIRGENMQPTRHPKIAIWQSPLALPAAVQGMIDDLEPLQHATDRQAVLAVLTAHIPEMKPWQPEMPRTGAGQMLPEVSAER